MELQVPMNGGGGGGGGPGQYRKKYVVYFVEICRGFYHPEGHFFGRLSPEKF